MTHRGWTATLHWGTTGFPVFIDVDGPSGARVARLARDHARPNATGGFTHRAFYSGAEPLFHGSSHAVIGVHRPDRFARDPEQMRSNMRAETAAIERMHRLGCPMVESLVIHKVVHVGSTAHPMQRTGQSTLVVSAAYEQDLFSLLHDSAESDIRLGVLTALCTNLARRAAAHAAELYHHGLLYIDLKLENVLHRGGLPGDAVPCEVMLCDYASIQDLALVQRRRARYRDMTHTPDNLDPRHARARVTGTSYGQVVAYALARDCALVVRAWSTANGRVPDAWRSVWHIVWHSVQQVVGSRLRVRPPGGDRCGSCTGLDRCDCRGATRRVRSCPQAYRRL
jgi:hypothetical protein